ncbi:hypothetical protein [Modestobacter sp. KNN46-3]|uniref:hypothetical protein n=1 Tax=Modestobacter sp. KNN46-3 TaxID=2711218 RepID=UPI0013E0492A|nr:hypothetical protein [Modestobacter sp. KNN46-3]
MAQYKAAGIDQKVVAATIHNTLADLEDFAASYVQEFQAPINGQKTSTVVIRKRPTVTLAAMPANRDGLLPRTSAASTSVEITLTDDDYFKVAVDTQEVEAGKMSVELGEAGARAIVAAGNAQLLAALEAGGTEVEFVGDATDGEAVWANLIGMVTTFQEAGIDSTGLILEVKPAVWATLIKGIATLRSAQDPREVAKTLLGLARVRVANLPSAKATLSHPDAAAQARVLSGIRSGMEDFDEIVEGRVKLGTEVLEPAAVLVLVDEVA